MNVVSRCPNQIFDDFIPPKETKTKIPVKVLKITNLTFLGCQVPPLTSFGNEKTQDFLAKNLLVGVGGRGRMLNCQSCHMVPPVEKVNLMMKKVLACIADIKFHQSDD